MNTERTWSGFESPSISQLLALTSRNLSRQYKGSVLGIFWILLEPVLYMVILSFVFSWVLKIGIDRYPLFLFAGLLPWNFFSLALTEGTQSLVQDGLLVKTAAFDRAVLPISAVLACFVNLVLSLLLFIAVLIFFGNPVSGALALMPVVLALHMLFTIGLALLLSSANAYFRDINNFVRSGLMLWFYLTPILYPFSMVPERFAAFSWLNPMVSFVNAYRSILLHGSTPDRLDLLSMIVAGFSMSALGIVIFRRVESGLAKVV